MRRHPLDIFHERDRLLENFAVDALQDVADRYACLTEVDAVRVVDVAVAVGVAPANSP